MIYFTTPFCAWFVTGCLKFIINSIKSKRLAFELIGYGGMPSNHSSIVASTTSLIAIREGVNSPSFGIALTVSLIVIMDAKNLRKQVGMHAKAINEINQSMNKSIFYRELVGHELAEILIGCFVGLVVALFLNYFI